MRSNRLSIRQELTGGKDHREWRTECAMEIDRTKPVNEIEQTAKAIPFAEILKGAFGRATTMVKQAFGELGQRLEFQIAASGYIDSSQEECLYDMVWYILENGMMVRQPMVLEIE